MATKRLFQLLAAVEDQPGVAASNLVDVANAKLLVSDPQVTYDRETYEREINRTSLTPLTPIAGVVEAECTFRVEVAGTSTADAVPDWSILLEACGLKKYEMSSTDIGAITAGGADAFYSGEELSGTGSGSGTGKVVHDTWEGATKLYHTGTTPVTGLITGATSLSTATASTAAGDPQCGWAWMPVSSPLVELELTTTSGDIDIGDIYIGGTGGAVIEAAEALGASTAGLVDFKLLDIGDFLSMGEVFTDTAGTKTFEVSGSGGFITTPTMPSVSLGVIEDGVKRLLKGCRGSVTFTANLGEPMFMDFTFKGLIASISDGQLTGTPVPTSKVPPVFLEIGYGVAADSPAVTPANEHTACINSWSVEYANEVAIERCAASTDGTRGAAFISGRAVTGSFDPSVRPEDRFKVYLNYTEFRAFFMIGVPPIGVGAADVNRAVFNEIDRVRAGGVGFEMYEENIGCF